MRGVSPELSVRRGREAVEFYEAAFGAVEIYRVGGTAENEDVVAQLSIGNATFWVSDESPPNQNFIEDGQIPSGNYYQGGTPNLTSAKNYGIRLDYNRSGSDRFFFRAAGTAFHEQLGDWTYETTKYKGLHVNDKTRDSWAYTGNWTKVIGSTVIE